MMVIAFIFYSIFRSNTVQAFIVQKVTSYLSKELGTKVTVKGVDISWFFNIVLEDIQIQDKKQVGLIKAKKIKVDFGKIDFVKNALSIYAIALYDAEINLRRTCPDSLMNFNFIIDYFASDNQTDSDTSKSMKLLISGLKLKNTKFSYIDECSNSEVKGVNFENLNFPNINTDIRKITINGGNISGCVKHLSFIEHSGFKIDTLSTDFIVSQNEISLNSLKLITPNSNIKGSLNFTFNNFSSFSYFIDSVKLNCKLEPTLLDIQDIGFFEESLYNLSNKIKLAGQVSGAISSLKFRDFWLGYGKRSVFKGEIYLYGLPNIEETFINVKINQFSTNVNDIKSINMPNNIKLNIDKRFESLGQIRTSGFFTGFINDFVSQATFNTEIGYLKTDISLKTFNNTISFNGKIEADKLNIGKIIDDNKIFGKIVINSKVSGNIKNKNEINMKMSAVIPEFDFNGNTLTNIKIDGNVENKKFNGELSVKDKFLDLDFNGLVNFSDSIPEFDFRSNINYAYLDKLNFWKKEPNSILSSKIDLNFTGANINNILGRLKFYDITLSTSKDIYKAKMISLISIGQNNFDKKLILNSDFIDAELNGKFIFSDFYTSMNNILANYLPSLNSAKNINSEISNNQYLSFNFHIKNPDPITQIFYPLIEISHGSTIKGNYNSDNSSFNMLIKSEQVKYDNIKFKNIFLDTENINNKLVTSLNISKILLSENASNDYVQLKNFRTKLLLNGDTINYNISWHDSLKNSLNNANIAGSVSFIENKKINATLLQANILLDGFLWELENKCTVAVDTISAEISNFKMVNNNQYILLNGAISKETNKSLSLHLKDIDLAMFEPIINDNSLAFQGKVTGHITLNDFYNQKILQSDLLINGFKFNNELLGNLKISSKWDNKHSLLNLNGNIEYKGNVLEYNPLYFYGKIFEGKNKKKNIDLNLELLNYKLATLQPFLSSFTSNIKGYATGKAIITGELSSPKINGELDIMRGEMKIDYTNVTYSFADKLTITPNSLVLSNIAINDSLGNTGTLNCTLRHNNFSKMYLDLNLKVSDMIVLNTNQQHNELFYGKAFGTGQIKIFGPLENLTFDIEANSERNTDVILSINTDIEADNNSSFINFINLKDTINKAKTYDNITNIEGINVKLGVKVDPKATINLILPEDIGTIKANGRGNIKLGIENTGAMNMYGKYTISNGVFNFSFQNVLNRTFNIEKDSYISFDGSPYKAEINVKAVYKIKASLKGLPAFSGISNLKSIPVECIIHLQNNLYNPDISFGLRADDIDKEIQQLLFSTIDTTNQVALTQQVVSLLAIRSFNFNSSTSSLASDFGASSLDILSNQLNNILSQFSDNIDIGVNYRAQDKTSSEELEVVLSTNLFNDRVTIDGNIGMTNVSGTKNTSNIIGDFNIDVKLTKDGKVRVRAFNKSNSPYEISSTFSNYKQGVGLYYRLDFDKISDLFRRKQKNQIQK